VAERLALVGMMGAGKSTVGALTAGRLGWRFVDVDEEVCASSGSSVAELFASRGEPEFRKLEAACLAEALAGGGDTVVAVGGGAVLDPGNRRLLHDKATVAWLRAAPPTLAARVDDDGTRPLLRKGGGSEAVLSTLDAERRPLYEEVADLVVDVDGLSPAQVVDRLCAALAQAAS
jgi:shikimate kinase